MRVTLKSIYTIFFFLGIFFIPFNSYEGIKQLGEFKTESSAFFFILGSFFLFVQIFYSKKISFDYKNKVLLILLLLLGWLFLSTLFNLPSVLESYFKKTTGINRFIRQYFVIILSAGVFFLLYLSSISKMSIGEVLYKVRKAFLFSFIVVSVYAFFEILYINFGIFPAYKVLQLFDYFPFTEFDVDTNKRISSVCFEPPALATFLITCSGWMFSYILTHKKKWRYLPTIIILILTYYSGSRTALIVILIQVLFFLAITLNRQQKVKVLRSFILLTSVILVTTVFSSGNKLYNDFSNKIETLDFVGNLKNNISNQSRFGIQYANLIVFKNNPIVGVGYGQQAYHAIEFYPGWAKKDNYEFNYMYLNKNNPSFPPGYNLFIRLLAETGIIGFSLFIFLLITLFTQTKKIIKHPGFTSDSKTLGIIIYITFIGLMFNWFQSDSFRVYGFWICLAIFVRIRNERVTTID